MLASLESFFLVVFLAVLGILAFALAFGVFLAARGVRNIRHGETQLVTRRPVKNKVVSTITGAFLVLSGIILAALAIYTFYLLGQL